MRIGASRSMRRSANRSAPGAVRIEVRQVVHGDDDRTGAGQRGQDPAEAGADGALVRDVAAAHPQQHDLERVPLRGREPGQDPVGHAGQQIGQADPGQPRLDPAGPGHEHGRTRGRQHVERLLPQRGLADAGIPGQHDCPDSRAARAQQLRDPAPFRRPPDHGHSPPHRFAPPGRDPM
jgi:hypothetical protein